MTSSPPTSSLSTPPRPQRRHAAPRMCHARLHPRASACAASSSRSLLASESSRASFFTSMLQYHPTKRMPRASFLTLALCVTCYPRWCFISLHYLYLTDVVSHSRFLSTGIQGQGELGLDLFCCQLCLQSLEECLAHSKVKSMVVELINLYSSFPWPLMFNPSEKASFHLPPKSIQFHPSLSYHPIFQGQLFTVLTHLLVFSLKSILQTTVSD